MTGVYKDEVKLSRRASNMSSPGSAESDEDMSSAFDEKAAYKYDGRSLLDTRTHGPTAKKPLIEYITNEWQRDPKYTDEKEFRPPARAAAYPESQMDDFLDRMDDCYDALIDLVKSPRFRRRVFCCVTALACSLWIWFSLIRPHIRETQAALSTFDNVKPSIGMYGYNSRPDFADMIQLKTLDPNLLPNEGKHRLPRPQGRRLVIVGDIHGCKDELVALLDKIRFDHKHDHLITTGDMIDKGPDSLGVVDLLREINASCVRGNHEDRVLVTRSGLQNMLKAPSSIEEQSKSSNVEDEERALARSLSKDQAAYLQSCPVILRIGEMSDFGGELVVVHAGLVPGVPLENQDPSSAMNMRVLDLKTYMPSRDHEREDSVPWARLWNKVQKLIPKEQSRYGKSAPKHSTNRKYVPRMAVIYGHDSRRGLQLEKWTKGLDSGCVRGGRLSALVLSEGGKQNLVQVKCKDYRPNSAPDSVETARVKIPGRKDRKDAIH